MTEEKVNWREIDVTTEAGKRQLWRKVAEAVGYRVEPFKKEDDGLFWGDYRLVTPTGEPMEYTACSLCVGDTEEVVIECVWKAAFDRQYRSYEKLVVPGYLDDLNAADTLLRIIQQAGYAIEVNYWAGNAGATLEVYESDMACIWGEKPLIQVGETEDPCLIRCYAYLAWEDTLHGT